eukprot:TRINITY_DN9646_c0_g1_i1.p1 TRINITY_DN9646_c0_g1~~TRINITY_DN9646_c0_g1_i1.p1  ORF type:complete len:455 (-),score=96.92 TRINITY_DN9646_c0_g1_i1:28-1320(-)
MSGLARVSLLGLSSIAWLSNGEYTLHKDYMQGNFFDKWEFFNDGDPTHGFVDYVDRKTAEDTSLINHTDKGVYIGSDFLTEVPRSNRGRQSIRLESTEQYNGGLFIITTDHMPTGCATWPAFWMFGQAEGHTWPEWGEYDIIEWTHDEEEVSTTLHTTDGCRQGHLKPGEHFSGEKWNPGKWNNPAVNCDVKAPGQWENQGCSQRGPTGSVGPSFNENGGGTFAAEWDPFDEHISTWFWPKGQEPEDVKQKMPKPSTWGMPFSHFSLKAEHCHKNHFKNMRLIFDLTFCGDFAGATWGDKCPHLAKTYKKCEDFVRKEPQAFKDAFWKVSQLDVYQSEDAKNLATMKEAKPEGTVKALQKEIHKLEALLQQKDSEISKLRNGLRQASTSLAGLPSNEVHKDKADEGGSETFFARRRRRIGSAGPIDLLKY